MWYLFLLVNRIFGMAFGSVFVFVLLTNLLLLHSAEEEKSTRPNCPSFPCGKFGTIGFPFTNVSYPSCGLLPVNCDETPPKIQLPLGLSRKPYEVINISYTNFTQSIRIKDFTFGILEYQWMPILNQFYSSLLSIYLF